MTALLRSRSSPRKKRTYEDLFAATQKLRQKMELVHALPDGG
jgi:hypothetical protein